MRFRRNPRVPCRSSVLPRINLELWRDTGNHDGHYHDEHLNNHVRYHANALHQRRPWLQTHDLARLLLDSDFTPSAKHLIFFCYVSPLIVQRALYSPLHVRLAMVKILWPSIPCLVWRKSNGTGLRARAPFLGKEERETHAFCNCILIVRVWTRGLFLCLARWLSSWPRYSQLRVFLCTLRALACPLRNTDVGFRLNRTDRGRRGDGLRRSWARVPTWRTYWTQSVCSGRIARFRSPSRSSWSATPVRTSWLPTSSRANRTPFFASWSGLLHIRCAQPQSTRIPTSTQPSSPSAPTN